MNSLFCFYYIVYIDKKEQRTEDRTLGDTSRDRKPLSDLSFNDNALFLSNIQFKNGFHFSAFRSIHLTEKSNF